MRTFEELIANAPQIEFALNYTFKDRSLFLLPFIHRSFANEHREFTEHNERLEFLGDSVLGLIISDYLYTHYPDLPEGDLSYLRSRLVEGDACVAYTQKLNIEQFLLLGKGEKRNDGKGRGSILADFFEAIVGAIYLDGGFEHARQFILTHFSQEIESFVQTPLKNWKAQLQDFCQKQMQVTPTYSILLETGPDHEKEFTVQVSLGEKSIGVGIGSSKKEAQQAAAQEALKYLNLQ